MEVTVIGAGVSGLTTAYTFQRAGHSVRVVASRPGLEATSGAAGAIWLPFSLEEGTRKAAWALHTYSVLRDLAGTRPEAGVDMLLTCQPAGEAVRPWWADQVEGAQLLDLAGIYPHAEQAWALQAPRVEPAIYLPWLESQLAGPVEWRTIMFNEVDGDLIVNCSGSVRGSWRAIRR